MACWCYDQRVPPRRRQPDPLPLEIRRFTPEEAEWATNLLGRRIAEVRQLDPNTVRYDDPQVAATEQRIRSTILEVFRENSPEYRDHRYHEIEGRKMVITGGFDDDPRNHEAEEQQNFAAGIPRTITMLEGLIGTVAERTDAARRSLSEVNDRLVTAKASDKVFIVHGQKEGPRDAVARFIAQLGLTPVILQEQASEGRTIIEKFERYSDVAYAVVLLTADDRGGLIDADASTYLPRARQNVILELGYFVGRLGRGHVCVLHEPGVEIPSDFHGVVYVALDAGGAWRLMLAKEMKVAGLDIDLNRAL